MTALVIAVAVLIVTLNLVATVTVGRSPRYEPRQKWLQMALIWVVPAVGAVLAWSLARDTPSARLTTDLTDSIGSGDGGSRAYDTSTGDVGSGDGGGGSE